MSNYTREQADRHMEDAEKKREEIGAWAIWSCSDWSGDLTKWDEVPFPDLQGLCLEGYYRTVTDWKIRDKTWQGLYKAANKMMEASGDEHHQFIEAFVLDQDDPESGIYYIITGS